MMRPTYLNKRISHNGLLAQWSLVPLSSFIILLTFAGCLKPPPQIARSGESSHAPKRHSIQFTNFAAQPTPPPAPHKRSDDKIVLGVDADFSHNSTTGGNAILRGVELAVDEINQAGGLLGRKLQVIVKDHHGNPRRGIDNIESFANLPNTLAVVGGVHTPVAIEELPIVHARKLLYLGPWAAGTPIVSNGYSPNFVFRVSVRDEYAGEFLVGRAVDQGYRRIGMLLEQTGWGKSNEKAIHTALAERGLAPSATAWFDWSQHSFGDQLAHLQQASSDVIILVANSPEGASAVNAMAALPADQRIPILSHWGILGGNFQQMTRSSLAKVDLRFLQTFSFVNNQNEIARELGRRYRSKYNLAPEEQIPAPFGTAHAYDLVQLLAAAVRQCNSLDRPTVRAALEKLPSQHGAVKDYAPPFSPSNHDALSIDDFCLMRFDAAGNAVPADTMDAFSGQESDEAIFSE